MQIKSYKTPHGRVLGMEADMRDIEDWAPTITQIRETILKGMVVGSHMFAADLPPEVAQYAPSQRMVERISDGCLDAIQAGRLIDFGAWTNEVIMHGGNRGGPLYTKGAIGHPFSKYYLFVHTWEYSTAVYLVNPLEKDRLAGGDCEAIELQPIKIKDQRALMIGDQVLLTPETEATDPDWRKYHCSAIPSVWRFMPGAAEINKASPPNAAAGNVLDPLMCALLILNTRGIDRQTVSVSDKLQRARIKNGKPPIPPYDQVDSRLYVTAIQKRLSKGRKEPSKGGHHASPIGHIRRGHIREYADGTTTFVRDSLVNLSENASKTFAAARSHYTVAKS
jgi:hypothetical protein